MAGRGGMVWFPPPRDRLALMPSARVWLGYLLLVARIASCRSPDDVFNSCARRSFCPWASPLRDRGVALAVVFSIVLGWIVSTLVPLRTATVSSQVTEACCVADHSGLYRVVSLAGSAERRVRRWSRLLHCTASVRERRPHP